MPLRDFLIVFLLVAGGFSLSSCYRDKVNHPADIPLFSLLPPAYTGISFANHINDTGDITLLNFRYIFAGGGVAVGDINNDGLQDIFFTGNQSKSRLYLNLGNFRFKDITGSTGIETQGGWISGAVMADVNGDGLTDIYVCRGGSAITGDTRNLLFINQGGLLFKESAKEYGIDDPGYSTSASFFDLDNDGDLDLYVLNYPEFIGDPMNFYAYKTSDADYRCTDHLYENLGEHFIDITTQAGLTIEKGFGLGIITADLNTDGYPDIYVSNDWGEPDFMYMNQKNKTFNNELSIRTSKTSQFGMGVDVGDINNDMIPDIVQCDMSPATHYRRNKHLWPTPIDYFFYAKNRFGIEQLGRNMMQTGTGTGHFVDQGEFYNVAKTEWSWSALLADFDNDTYKDLFITNGLKRDEGDMDYEKLMFGENDKVRYKNDSLGYILNMPKTLLENPIYKNQKYGGFIKANNLWGINQAVNTQGAAYADLNNDGNLDLILNNTDTTAFIYGNIGERKINNYLRISITDEIKNKNGIGTKAWLYHKGQVLYSEITNARGFQSSSEPILHFGLGTDSIIDSVVVVFTSAKYTVLRNLKGNKHLMLNEAKAEGRDYYRSQKQTIKHLLQEKTEEIFPPFIHQESDYNDFKRDKLIPRMFSKEGPALAVGDLNGDNLDDFYMGGAAGQGGAIYLQQTNGSFTLANQPSITADAASEDVAALITDLNSDGKKDLYVVSGSNEFPENDNRYRDRIYINEGAGNMNRCYNCMPDIRGSKSCIAHYDYDNDGDTDLFIGGRTLPGSYGKIPRSYLLQNDAGKFSDVTHNLAPSLEYAGMITSAIWVDLDGDKNAELLAVGDWMSPSIFKYQAGKFENFTPNSTLPTYTGWWNCITTGDFDHDGDIDFACGNWGLNSIWKASKKEPLCLLVNDFDDNGSVDPILCCYLKGENGTFAGRDLICQGMPKYFNKYNTYEAFAKTKVENLFSKELYEAAQKLAANELQTCLFMNKGKGNFEVKPLPFQCQIAPVNSIIFNDFDGDGKSDLLLAGNTNQNFYDQGNIDALQGILLKGDGLGHFSPVSFTNSGINLTKYVRQMRIIQSHGKPHLLCGNNNDTLQLFSIRQK